MLKLRLMRKGAKRKPFYTLIAVDSSKPAVTWPIKRMGFYNPIASVKNKLERFRYDESLVQDFINKGAQITDRVFFLLNEVGFFHSNSKELEHEMSNQSIYKVGNIDLRKIYSDIKNNNKDDKANNEIISILSDLENIEKKIQKEKIRKSKGIVKTKQIANIYNRYYRSFVVRRLEVVKKNIIIKLNNLLEEKNNNNESKEK